MTKYGCRFYIYAIIAGMAQSCTYHDLGTQPCLPAQPGIVVTPESDCFSEDGAIIIDVAGADPAYRYAFQLQVPVNIPEFKHLAAGSYYIEVIDGKNCKTGFKVEVPRVLSNVSWSNEVKTIIETRCSKPACHGGSNRLLFGSYETVKRYAQQIRHQVAGQSMPLDGRLSDEEIKKIVCWVESGAPEN